MGIHQEKYTKEYYLCVDENGNALNYGATLQKTQGRLTLRNHDSAILDRVSFANRSVLCLGCGRGEEIVYAMQHGAEKCVGLDFSQAAIALANELIQASGISQSDVELVAQEALSYVTAVAEQVADDASKRFDIIIMLDFIEHIPRNEAKALMQALMGILHTTGVIVINTPCYKYDNDVIANGLDARNGVNCIDTSDTNPATCGMHCNKYTCVSLQEFMTDCGFVPVTEAHYYIMASTVSPVFQKISYYARWNQCKESGVCIQGAYEDDEVEYPYTDAAPVEYLSFSEGDLAGISLLTTKAYAAIAYPDGQIDREAILELQAYAKSKSNLVVFDVGGFVGANAMVYAGIVGEGGSVVVFEPNPYNRNRIFKNLSHNVKLEKRIIVEPTALGTEDACISMVLSSNIDDGYSSTSRIANAHAKISESALPDGFVKKTVAVTSLDGYVERNQIVPDVIKIDVEGAETMVLQGAQHVMQAHKPQFFIEFHSEYCATTCTQLLLMAGYQIFPCKEEPDNRLIVKALWQSGDNGNAVSSAENQLTYMNHIGVLLSAMHEQEYVHARYLDMRERQIQNLQNELEATKQALDTLQNSRAQRMVKSLRDLKSLLKKERN